MKNKNSVIILTAMSVLLLGFSATARASNKLFSSIQQICSAYQVNMNSADMNLVTHPDGSKELTINVESGRNNFDRIMLIAFYAAGKAMKYHQESIDQVTIVVSMEYKGSSSVYATATMDDIVKYIDGSCSSSDFVRKLKFS
ncbi:MAG: hypothetical protein V1681_09035 [Candidatus Neomarinimicrobiota bacterium]